MAENKIKPGGLAKAKESGRSWRLLAHKESGDLSIENEGLFDELVLDHWFHMERMQERLWWLRVGDARLLVELHEDGSAALKVERGFYEDVVAPSDEAPSS
ncbi:MAG: hypothetical protein D6773_11525 [Alphaproteobacteria bacterium]|nr:MAG: hypothetical protein D6773_11525 [Alphaproteobacteria bacterium]